MAQDIRDLFKDDASLENEKMPLSHQDRFLKKLDADLPIKRRHHSTWLRVAASITVLMGLSFGVYTFLKPAKTNNTVVTSNNVTTKTLGDVSPGFKKVEDYYLASINLELSKITYTPDTKDLFDDYLKQLEALNKEYKHLSLELTESGPSELTVNALIDNLKYRLNLLYRLRTQLKELNASNTTIEGASQSI